VAVTVTLYFFYEDFLFLVFSNSGVLANQCANDLVHLEQLE